MPTRPCGCTLCARPTASAARACGIAHGRSAAGSDPALLPRGREARRSRDSFDADDRGCLDRALRRGEFARLHRTDLALVTARAVSRRSQTARRTSRAAARLAPHGPRVSVRIARLRFPDCGRPLGRLRAAGTARTGNFRQRCLGSASSGSRCSAARRMELAWPPSLTVGCALTQRSRHRCAQTAGLGIWCGLAAERVAHADRRGKLISVANGRCDRVGGIAHSR